MLWFYIQPDIHRNTVKKHKAAEIFCGFVLYYQCGRDRGVPFIGAGRYCPLFPHSGKDFCPSARYRSLHCGTILSFYPVRDGIVLYPVG